MRQCIKTGRALIKNLGVIILVLMSIHACSNTSSGHISDTAEADLDKISVATTTNLIQDWVENVGGDRVEVMSIITHGVDPHNFKPTPRNLKDIEKSSLFVLIGNGYEESWVKDAVNNTDQEAIELSNEIWDDLTAIAERDFVVHDDHDKYGLDAHAGHDHGDHGYDLHFWHDPIKVVSAIDAISQVLVKMEPNNSEYFRDNASKYKQELVDVDNWISSELSKIPDEKRILVTNHESMGYFADRYDFHVLGSVIGSFSSDSKPTPKNIANILDIIEEHNVDVIFGEPQMKDKIAKSISGDTGVRVAILHSESLGSEGSNIETYIDMLKVNVAIIVDNLNK